MLLPPFAPPASVMPIPRPLPLILAVFVSAFLGAAAVAAATLPEPAKASPPATSVDAMADIVFYLARGEADACGRGCNEWIAAEGKIDAGAASRLRRLLAKLGRRRPSIYFNSPGGSVAGGLELGRLIRDQKLTVSVGHTIPSGCDRDKPLEKSCDALKRSGQELEAELDQVRAQCNSSCVYTVAGGTVRVIPPWVKLGIHDVGLDPDKKPPPGALAEEAKRVAHARIQEYLRDMGIDKELYTAAVATPYASIRLLDRDEIVRFGMDRRAFGENVWQTVDKPRPLMEKGFFVRTDSDQPRYLDGVASLACGVGTTIRVALAWQHVASQPAGPTPHSVGITVNGLRVEFDTRLAWLPGKTFDGVGDSRSEVSELDLNRNDGSVGSLTLNMDGFSAAYAKLRKSCDEAARDARAVALRTAPWLKPVAIPSIPGDSKSPWNSPAARGPAVLQNSPAAPIPPATETVQFAPEAAASPTRAEPTQ
jgi:hypothetical protein